MIKGRDRTPAEQERFMELASRLRARACRSVAAAWEDGRLLAALKTVCLFGEWERTHTGLGYSASSAYWRVRVFRACPSAEAAGRYPSMQKAFYAHQEGADVCPGCSGRKQPEYRVCPECREAEEANRAAARRAAREEEAERAALLAAVEEGQEARYWRGQLAEHQRALEEARASIAEKDEQIALLQRALAEQARGVNRSISNDSVEQAEPVNRSISNEVDWLEARADGATAAVVEHCLRGSGNPWWVRCRGKRPVGKWGMARAFLEDLQPGEELGVVPGSLGCRVLDVDSQDGSPVEWAALEPLFEALGEPALSMRSRSGLGWHLWYRAARRVGNCSWRLGALRGEVRDSAGYVVVAEPEALLAVIEDLPHRRPVRNWSALLPPARRAPGRLGRSQSLDSAWAVQALERVQLARNGARNNTLFAVACEGFRRGLPEAWFEHLGSLSSLQEERGGERECRDAIASARRTVLGAN